MTTSGGDPVGAALAWPARTDSRPLAGRPAPRPGVSPVTRRSHRVHPVDTLTRCTGRPTKGSPTCPVRNAARVESFGHPEDGLDEATPWYHWGPYLSERAWGTVREDYSAGGAAWDYFPHDHARSRAYRWGEDGMAGVSDVGQNLCMALALWNGRDPILKERMFGLTGPEGNHGEDVKEYWWFLDALPSHAWLRWRYHYPQAEFPYADLVAENGRRDQRQPEYELMDTGVFDDDRYWVVEVVHAKADPHDLLMEVSVTNAGPEAATLHVLPQLWFRNTWSWDVGRRPAVAEGDGPRPGRGGPPAVRRADVGARARTRRRVARAAVLRQRHQQPEALRLGLAGGLPEGRDQRPRRGRCADGQPGPASGRRARPGTASPWRRARRRWSGSGCGAVLGARLRRSVRRGARAASRGGRRVLRRGDPGRRRRRRPPGGAAGLRRDDLGQAVLPLRREALARRRPHPAAAPAGAPDRAQRRLAQRRRPRHPVDARSLGVPVVRRLGPRLPHGGAGPPRPGVRQVPAAR